MEWFAWVAPVWNGALPTGAVPGAMQYGTGLLQLVAMLTALVPVLLVLRQVFKSRSGATEAPRLRVLEGGKELRRRAA
jgi:hypothetical protein